MHQDPHKPESPSPAGAPSPDASTAPTAQQAAPTSFAAPGSGIFQPTDIDGRYRLLRVIGRGGMGTVYLAQQQQPNRFVAIKLLPGPLEHADATLKKLEELLDWPQVTRMPCYLLVGPSYSGKTSILEHFVRRHPPDLDPLQEVTRYPVVMIDAPPKPDLSDFYSRILDALMTAYKPTAPVHAKYSQVKHLFGQLGVKVLVIDEIHHLIAGSLNRQREFRNALKSLSNEAKISIVAALGYFISPIDAIPDFLPGGYVDDLGVMTLLLGQLDVFVDAEGSKRVAQLLPRSCQKESA